MTFSTKISQIPVEGTGLQNSDPGFLVNPNPVTDTDQGSNFEISVAIFKFLVH
jgi:hypothetical protein